MTPTQAAPSEHVSPLSHCHPLGTKWVGLKRLGTADYSTAKKPLQSAPHQASSVTSARVGSRILYQSACWVGRVIVNPDSFKERSSQAHAAGPSDKWLRLRPSPGFDFKSKDV